MNSRRDRNFCYPKVGTIWGTVAVCVFYALLCAPAHAQDADVSGTVRDAAGAVIPNASVNLTNEATGVTLATQTNPQGLYAFPHVQAGVYDLTTSASGFKKEARVGVTVNVAERAEVDFELKVGATNETVTVTAQQESLQTGDAVTGQVIDRTFINDLPLISRSALDLAFLAPGVNQPPNFTYGQSAGNVPYLTGNNFVSNGSRNATSDIQIDGTTTGERVSGGLFGFATYTPSVDAVQEFKVQQTNFSAEYGFSGGTVTNVVTRSGTNSFHGSAYEFLRNNILDSNDYFNNLHGNKLPPLHQNIFGGTIGGPIFKNKTFFFFDYEGTRNHTLGTSNAGVPSAAEKTGDFGELCTGPASAGFGGGTFNSAGQCSNSADQLWDPYSAAYQASAGGPVSTTFIPFNNLATYASPGNPKLNNTGFQLSGQAGDLIDPVASKLMSYYPAPNVSPSSPTYSRYLNWFGSGANLLNNNQYDIKIDHHFDDRNGLSAKYSKRGTLQEAFNCYGNLADPCSQGPVNSSAHVFSLNYNHIFSPATLFTFSYGYTRAARLYPGPQGANPVTLGMPSYIEAASGHPEFPAINLNYTYAAANPGDNNINIGTAPWTYLKDGQDTHDLIAALSHLSGRHELKFGVEGRWHRFNNVQPGTPAGYFNYSSSGTFESWAGGGGDSMASFLTGYGGAGAWGQYEIPVFLDTQNFAWAGYAQDNFHVNHKLTVNVGLRYDLTLPETETSNKLSWLDPNAVSPLQVPGLPTLHGGNVFATPQNRSDFNTDPKDFQPRVGLAYRLNDKTVIRTGYGIYFDPSKAAANADVVESQGFVQDTNWLTTYQGDGATPWGRLSNPWPTGLTPVEGSKLGLLTNVGGKVQGGVKNWNATPYEQSWSFGIQRSLPWNMLVETDYIGKKGTHLYFGVGGDYNLNHLGPQEERYTAAQITALNTKVPNPFFGYITTPGSDLGGPTVSQYQLDLPYPQFDSVLVFAPPWANSIYHAFQLRVEKHFSDGLQLLFTYVNSKSIDTASAPNSGSSFLGGSTSGVLDPNDLSRERSLSTFDIPQTWQVSYVYQLPFGRGKQFGGGMNPVLNAIVGGWQTNGIWRFDDGQPLALALTGGQALPGYGQRAEQTGAAQINPRSEWATKGYFANPTVFSVPAAFTLGNTGRTMSSLRAPGTANATLSVFKEFGLNKLREGMHLEYRLEAFNAFNHTQFCPPNTTVQYNPANGTGVGNFGQITCQANVPRQAQMALKFYF